VPVLVRLQARTGISFTVICWSWDAHWLRPAYPSSPSQSYPQEEDKIDDMEIPGQQLEDEGKDSKYRHRWD
jgi:hypothetical protein